MSGATKIMQAPTGTTGASATPAAAVQTAGSGSLSI